MGKWKEWARAAGMRAAKTVAETAVATIGSAAAISAVDWRVVASASVLAGILSMLVSVKGLPEVSATNGDRACGGGTRN